MADELGVTTVPEDATLRLCDGSRIETLEVEGSEAIETWEELRRDAPDSGLWPVVIGAREDWSGLAETVRFNCKDGHTFQRTLERAESVDLDAAISRVARAYRVRAQHLRGSLPLPSYRYPKDQFLVPFDLLTEEPLPKVRIALLPIDRPWHATAILPWGFYNDNPAPAVHTAILRDWSQRYGAVPVSMTGEVLELSAARPPTDDRTALALAREQFRYAPDIVQQGLGKVENLAAALKNGRAWYFWWD